MLRNEDFNNDKKDAGEIGAGHTVTALYEIVPPGEPIDGGDVDPLKYQDGAASRTRASTSDELMTVKLRYKAPDGDTSQLISVAGARPRRRADAQPRLRVGGRRVRHAAAEVGVQGPGDVVDGAGRSRGATAATIPTAIAPSSCGWSSWRRRSTRRT